MRLYVPPADESMRRNLGWLTAPWAWPLLFALLSFAFNIAESVRRGWHEPGRPSDGIEFDSMALNTLRGRGIGFYPSDPEFRAPYAAANQDGRFDELLARRGDFAPTALRPPGYPAALALVYGLCGRSFAAIHLLNSAAVAAAVGLAVALARRWAGAGAAIAVGLLAVADKSLQRTAAENMTEPLAIFSLLLLVAALVHAVRRGTWRAAARAGVVMGWCILLRTAFTPLVGLGIVLLLFASKRQTGLSLRLHLFTSDGASRPDAIVGWLGQHLSRRSLSVAAVFASVTLVVLLPWSVRNCLFLGTFAPQGAQGGDSLCGAYCDEALAAGGDWAMEAMPRVWQEYCAARRDTAAVLSPGEYERQLMQAGSAAARQWIAAHTDVLPAMFAGRLRTTWQRYLAWRFPPRLPLVLLLALVAPWVAADRRLALMLWSFLAVNTLLCMALYPAGGRLQTSFDLVVVLLAGMALAALARRWRERRAADPAAAVAEETPLARAA